MTMRPGDAEKLAPDAEQAHLKELREQREIIAQAKLRLQHRRSQPRLAPSA